MNEEESIKILVVGDLSTGKSALVDRFMSDQYMSEHFATVGIRYKSKHITREFQRYSLQIWDSSGNRNSIPFVKNYYHMVDGYLFVYDISHYRTFTNLPYWIKMAPVNDAPKMIVGCKNDLTAKEVPFDLASQFAKDNQMGFLETSAIDGFMVNEAFQLLIYNIIETKYGRPISNSFSDMITIYSFSDSASRRSSELSNSNNTSPSTSQEGCCGWGTRWLYK